MMSESECRTEKIPITIDCVLEVTNKQAKVKLPDGKTFWITISEAERYGNKIFIPAWYYKKLQKYLGPS